MAVILCGITDASESKEHTKLSLCRAHDLAQSIEFTSSSESLFSFIAQSNAIPVFNVFELIREELSGVDGSQAFFGARKCYPSLSGMNSAIKEVLQQSKNIDSKSEETGSNVKCILSWERKAKIRARKIDDFLHSRLGGQQQDIDTIARLLKDTEVSIQQLRDVETLLTLIEKHKFYLGNHARNEDFVSTVSTLHTIINELNHDGSCAVTFALKAEPISKRIVKMLDQARE